MPWRLIGENVRVVIAGDQLRISHAGREVAVHPRRTGRFQRVVDPFHFDGVVGSGPRVPAQIAPVCDTVAPPELLRPLSNMSGWSEGAGDGPRSSARDAEPAQADGDP